MSQYISAVTFHYVFLHDFLSFVPPSNDSPKTLCKLQSSFGSQSKTGKDLTIQHSTEPLPQCWQGLKWCKHLFKHQHFFVSFRKKTSWDQRTALLCGCRHLSEDCNNQKHLVIKWWQSIVDQICIHHCRLWSFVEPRQSWNPGTLEMDVRYELLFYVKINSSWVQKRHLLYAFQMKVIKIQYMYSLFSVCKSLCNG